MKKIFHIVVGTAHEKVLFHSLEDEKRLKDYLHIYKERNHLEIFAYSMKSTVLHLIIRAEHADTFIQGLMEAYQYYLEMKYQEEYMIKMKVFIISSMDEFWKLMRYLHQQGSNSGIDYMDYTRYRKHPFLDMGPIIQSFQNDSEDPKKQFFKEVIKENVSDYTAKMEKLEVFEVDKMSKRRARAEEFFDDFLREHHLNKFEIMLDENKLLRVTLIERFRKETDLSFRDIGYVLGISHTSVIRTLQMNQPRS
ncbi:transposase [Guggenheimella bovis]